MTPFFSESFIRIAFERELHAIKAEWIDTPTSEEFRIGMNAIIKAFQTFNSGVLLCDTLHLGVIDPKDSLWTCNNWKNRALNAGYRQFAIISSPDVFTQISVEKTIEMAREELKNHTVIVQSFKQEELARQWIEKTNLLQQPSVS